MKRTIRLLLCLAMLPVAARAQQLQVETPPPEQAALAAQLLAWTRFYTTLIDLQEWTITLRIDSLTDGILANTMSNPNRKIALIQIDPRVTTDSEPWRVILHELIHVVTAQPHLLAWNLAGMNEEARGVVQYIFEDTVQRISFWPVWPKPPGGIK